MTESNEHVSARREPDPKPTSPETTAAAIVPAGWTRFFAPASAALLAGVVALLIGCLHLYYLHFSPTPYDLRVLGQTELLAGTVAGLRVIVNDRDTHTGVKGVPVQVYLEGDNPRATVCLADFKTDRYGTGAPRLELPQWQDGAYTLRIVCRPPGGQEEARHQVELRRSWQITVSTDRPVYQPGQRILVRGLALRRPDLKPVAEAPVLFTVMDPKGNKIFSRKGTTSKYGIVSAECALADEVHEGIYQVECQVDKSTGRIPVEVKTYVLPKFKVAVTLKQSFYQPHERLQGKVQAFYFHGKPVARAEVALDVRMLGDADQAANQLKVRTDVHGTADFLCPLPTSVFDRTREKDAEVALTARVTDTAGQEQSAAVSRLVSTKPLRIEVIPEGGNLVQDVPNTVYLLTTYPDGEPARTKLTLAGWDEPIATDSLGIARVEVTPSEQRVFSVQASDAAGRSASREVTLPCGTAGEDFLLRTDKAVYDGRDTMHVTILGKGNSPIFLDFLKDRQTLWTQRVKLIDGRGECALKLPADVFGVLELCSYRFDAAERPVSKKRVVYVRQPRQLTIEALANQKEYRPGKTARVTFHVRDDEGKAAPGALSLAAVDEAVFAMHRQGPTLDTPLSPDEAKLLQPVHAVYPWSPDAGSPEPMEQRSRFEQALFARTAAQKGKADREALLEELLPFVEGNRRIFEMLDMPDWEKWVNPRFVSPQVLAMLHQAELYHSLSSSSYPEKVHIAKVRQRKGVEFVQNVWAVYAVVVLVVTLVYAIRFLSKQDALGCVVALLVVFMLMGLLLPAVQKVRQASFQGMMINNLRQIEFAMESARAANPDLLSRLQQRGDAPKVRQWFPETLLWLPEVVTDDNGRAEIDMPLADSITTWRLTAKAVTANGHIGAERSAIRVFQPFFVDLNLPVALTLGDEITVPAVVSNYLDNPQTVTLMVAEAPWFELRDQATRKIDLGIGEVRAVGFRLRVRQVGRHQLQISAQGAGVGDAVQRDVEVVPGGRRTELVVNGNLQRPAEIDLVVPAQVIDGSAKGLVRIYPSSFSQVVEGLDQIFQLPHGCFEQTSSTTYPNVLALDYLRRMNQFAPAVEQKARQYIHLGYQRLLTFEVPGGGFDWFGRPPANQALTAYGLMEFEDMARVHDVDPNLIERTRRWLLKQRQPDGSWEAAGGRHNFGERTRQGATAYIAWAVFANGKEARDMPLTRDFLLKQDPAACDPYTLALVCNALLAVDPKGTAVNPYLDRLVELKRTSAGGEQVWWEQDKAGRTLFFESGPAGNIETTALATLALLAGNREPGTIRGALAWLAAQKDGQGTWHSTQATVLALRAILAGTGRPLGGPQDRRIDVLLDGKLVENLVIPADQADVVQLVRLTSRLAKGTNRLRLIDRTGTASLFQVVFSYHTPAVEIGQPDQLGLTLTYDRAAVKVNECATATAVLTNRKPEQVPMVMLELPIPPGFVLEGDELVRLAASPAIAKVQRKPAKVLLYLRALDRGQTLRLNYRLRATTPGKVTAAPGVAWEYYNPEPQSRSREATLTVSDAK